MSNTNKMQPYARYAPSTKKKKKEMQKKKESDESLKVLGWP